MQPKPEPKYTHPHRTAQPGVAGYNCSAHTNTHTPQYPSRDWRGSRNPSPSTHTPSAHPNQEWRGTSGARTQTHTDLNTRARSGGAQLKPDSKHTHPHRTLEPGIAGYRQSAHTTTQAREPEPGMAGCRLKPRPKRTHHKPQPGMMGRNQNLYPSTHTLDPGQDWRVYRETHTQTQAPHKGRKPSVHSPGTEEARTMQVSRPSEIRRLGVRMHPKACAALGL